jgi:transposase
MRLSQERAKHLAMQELEIRKRFELLKPTFNERTRRLWAAAEARAAGPGSICTIAKASGISRPTILQGIRELDNPSEDFGSGKIRSPGGGAPSLLAKDPTIKEDLERLIAPDTRGDPESPLRWTCKSTRNLANALRDLGHKICPQSVANLLHSLKYSLQGNRKTKEGGDHPDRNAQFEHINATVQSFIGEGEPAISVDTKKKELVGEFKNNGREWHPAGSPETVNVHDFPTEAGKVAPYGVYDLADDSGWVNVGIDHDTAAFAVESIRQWWTRMGQVGYPTATKLLITADCGGSNGARVRLWKSELQKLADETGLTISVCHFPPGTSKWNKIEHCLFSFITMNWRGRPLVNYQTIIGLIGSTKTTKGLRLYCDLDTSQYPLGVKVSDKRMSELNITRHTFHGEWNYSIAPKTENKE